MTLDCLCLLLFCSELLATRFASHLFRHASRGLAPEPSDDRATTVDNPPERWFHGTSPNLTGVAQLRLAHALTQIRAPTGAAELPTQFHRTVTWAKHGLMVTEMGQGWPADISCFVLKYGAENIIPFSRLHAEASRSGQPLNSQPNVSQEVAGSWFDGAERALSNQPSPACRGRTA